MISLDYKDRRPLHEQITDGFKNLIVSGILKPDEKLPSVRSVSISLTVNPNTVQKAYKELENTGFIYSITGKGSFVSQVNSIVDDKRKDELYKNLYTIVKELSFLGETKESVQNLLNNVYAEKEAE